MGVEYNLYYLIPLVLAALFAVAFRRSRASLMPGILLTCAAVSLTAIFFLQAYFSDSRFMKILSVIPLALAVLLVGTGVYVFIGFLFVNTHAILKREKRDLKHILTLALAILLLLLILVPRFVDMSALPTFLIYLGYSIYALIIFYLLHLAQYIVSMILSNLSRPRLDQDYIIVLGCWVKDGKVTPILARRLDKAIEFYNRQKAVGRPPNPSNPLSSSSPASPSGQPSPPGQSGQPNPSNLPNPPKLVLSGGQGPDESCPEAEAMKAYALEKGIPEEHILTETESTSTLENLKFSKLIMDADFSGKTGDLGNSSANATVGKLSDNAAGGTAYRCIYATNNYHVLRAGIYARRAGLRIHGIGARTAFYYLPNAILREYIAYSYLYLKWNVAFVVCSLIAGSVVLPLVIERYFPALLAL